MDIIDPNAFMDALLTEMRTDLVTRIARVQELCEALSRPTTAKGARFVVEFDDGSTAPMDDVLALGREALADVANFFDVDVPAIATRQLEAPLLSEEAARHVQG